MANRTFVPRVFPALFLIAAAPAALADHHELEAISRSLLFHASFDESFDADFAKGNPAVHTSASGNIPDAGTPGMTHPAAELTESRAKYGKAARFTDRIRPYLFYQAHGNVPYSPEGFSGSVSLWLTTDPTNELKPGFTDPFQITDDKWNDSAFFIDFTPMPPRDFRLGVYSDFAVWNPTQKPVDQIPDSERPLITDAEPPFNADTPVHVAFTFDKVNHPTEPAVTRLYVNGKLIGERRNPEKFTWDTQKATIQIALNYIGVIDDLAIFDRALSEQEINAVMNLAEGIKPLHPTGN